MTRQIVSDAPDLFAPGLFDGTGFYDAFAWYRAHDPVSWQQPEGSADGFWSVTKYRDVVAVHRDSTRMSSTKGIRLGTGASAAAAVADKMLIVSDPPHHTRMKRVLAQPFSHEVLTRAETYVEAVVADVVAAAMREPEPDLLTYIRRIPTDVICAIMGLPREDWEWIGKKTTEAFESPSDVQRATANSEIFQYFYNMVGESTRTGANAFIRSLLGHAATTNTDPESARLTDEEVIFNLSGILSGGNETTRFTLASLTLQLAHHPDQWRRITTGEVDPTTATEEALRWSAPGMHVMRTATEPLRIGDTDIAPGHRVVTWTGSANRDEDVFAAPDTFDVGRTANRHLTFGAGRHMCLGSRLARLQITAYLRTLRRLVRTITATGEPRYNGSNFAWGLNELPVELRD
ncbi:cytochrome P450 [Catenulispora subtropica]